MLDIIGTIAGATALATFLAVVVCTIPVGLPWRLAIAAIGGAWVGVAIAVAASGALAAPALLGVLFASPLVAGAGLALAFPAVRSALLAMPLPLVIGLNFFRLLGVEFLVLASVGRLSGPFPLSAAWGDIVTGALAIPVAILATRVRANDPRILAWSAFGTLDLVVAMLLGVTSANGSPLQLIHAGVGSAAVVAGTDGFCAALSDRAWDRVRPSSSGFGNAHSSLHRGPQRYPVARALEARRGRRAIMD
jgi:hypothetical protein